MRVVIDFFTFFHNLFPQKIFSEEMFRSFGTFVIQFLEAAADRLAYE